MSFSKFAYAAAMFGLISADRASAGVIYDLTEVNSDASAEATWETKVVPTVMDAEHLGATRTTLAGAVTGFQATSVANASSSNPSNPSQSAVAENSEEVKVLLSSASAGYMEFGGLTSATVSPGTNFGAAAAANKGSTAGYEFTITSAGDVNISWNAAGNNSTPYAYTVELENLSNTVFANFYVATNAIGSVDVNIPIGTYELFSIDNPGPHAPDLVSAIGSGAFASGEAKGTFHFSITSVPEPATWELMLAGLAIVGFARFSCRRLATSGAAC
jgi:hypothetical protein